MASRRAAIETERMLDGLRQTLYTHAIGDASLQYRADAKSLRRISMPLHRWHEMECNEDIQRGKKNKDGSIEEFENGQAWIADRRDHADRTYYRRIPDREAGAKKRLGKIMSRYPTLQAYVQTDPRGCALYILRPGDVPAGADVSAYYSRGLAVCR